jgi:hypothetical protein
MSKATYEDATLILRLYDLRREEKLREAREWFAAQFYPQTLDDIKAVLAPGSPRNGAFRMVVSYWDMAASFAVRGPLDAALLLESAGELILVWAKLEPLIAEMREWAQLPEWLQNLEAIIERVDWAPGRVAWLKARFAAYRPPVDSPPKP